MTKNGYSKQTVKVMRGRTKNRLMTLGTLRLNVMTKLFNAIGRGEEIRTRFEDLLKKYDDVIQAEADFYKLLYEKISDEE